MFTGIVEEVGRVGAASGGRLFIAARRVVEGTTPGDSINVNGACLTATKMEPGGFSVELMAETRQRTNLGRRRSGDYVNLERALKWGGRIGGHLVQGHVDATAGVRAVSPRAGAVVVRFSLPAGLVRYVAPQGFVAVDGVSLTVIDCNSDSFAVSLVGFTREHTTLGRVRVGDKVNIEVDIMAKYLEGQQPGGSLSAERLRAFLER
ncbi:MAG: riboflavin synthase [Dehalococcoidia bacterium]|nr:riboflavin synthase [Dehalococcoidia bacterium]MDP7240434.1 riboflavin synthase [Dehalococcoidia bacterium]